MKNISKFASEFSKIEFGQQLANKISIEEIMQQPAAQIPWYTLVEITYKSKSHDEMLWYINQTHKKGGIKNERNIR